MLFHKQEYFSQFVLFYKYECFSDRSCACFCRLKKLQYGLRKDWELQGYYNNITYFDMLHSSIKHEKTSFEILYFYSFSKDTEFYWVGN